MRTSAAIALFVVANTGLRSSSTISGKSVTSCDTLTMTSASAVAVHRLAAAHALQHLVRLDAVEHRERVFLGRGREAEGDVLQHLDQHAAEAERHQLAERAVGDRADDDFGAAGQHLLHLDALDLGVGLILLGICENGVVGLFGIRRVLTPTMTPPASVLWRMSGETIFITTGKPIEEAILAASAADLATPSFGTGMP